jgi:hypothetical protein
MTAHRLHPRAGLPFTPRTPPTGRSSRRSAANSSTLPPALIPRAVRKIVLTVRKIALRIRKIARGRRTQGTTSVPYLALASGFRSLSGVRRRGDSDTEAVPYCPRASSTALRCGLVRLALSRLPDPGSALSPSSRLRSHVEVFCPAALVFVVLADRAWCSNPGPSQRACPSVRRRVSEMGVAGWKEAERLAPRWAGGAGHGAGGRPDRGGGVRRCRRVGGLGTGRPGGAVWRSLRDVA